MMENQPLLPEQVDLSQIKLQPLEGKTFVMDYDKKDHIPLQSPWLNFLEIRNAKQKDYMIMYVSIKGEITDTCDMYLSKIAGIEEGTQKEIKRLAPKLGAVTFRTIIQHKKDDSDRFYRLIINKNDKKLFVDEAYRPYDYNKLTKKNLLRFVLVVSGVFYEPNSKEMGLEYDIHRIMVRAPARSIIKKQVRYTFADQESTSNANLVETEFPHLVEEEDLDDKVCDLNHLETDVPAVGKKESILEQALNSLDINLSDSDDE
jgi:hypothetical protein